MARLCCGIRLILSRAHSAVVQAAVQRLTDLQSVLTTTQALLVILTLLQWAAIASTIPRFDLLCGARPPGRQPHAQQSAGCIV